MLSAPRESSESTTKKPLADNLPPSYDANTVPSSSAAGSYAAAGAGAPARSDGDDRPLPPGWVKQWDST